MLPERLKMVLLVVAALAVGTASAQDEEQSLYTVEVVVFLNSPAAEPAYRWPGEPDIDEAMDLIKPEPLPPPITQPLLPNPAAGDPQQATRFGDAAAGFEEEFVGPPEPVILPIDPNAPPSPLLAEDLISPFQLLPKQEWLLSGAWARLLRSSAHTPLVHMAWRQPASPFGEPTPIRVHGGATVVADNPPSILVDLLETEPDGSLEQIDGTVALERGRFLHLRIDLILREAISDTSVTDGPSPLQPSILDRGEGLEYRNFRLQERRQVQRSSINYFDHRHFGIIAIVNEWQPPEPETLADPLVEQ
jgi:hypothetical protein